MMMIATVVTADNIHIGVVCEVKYITILAIAMMGVEGTGVTMMTMPALVLVFLSLFHIVVWDNGSWMDGWMDGWIDELMISKRFFS
jgi:hypothetical protein